MWPESIFDRAAALIASSVLHDNASCFQTNTSLVLYWSKTRRCRQKLRSSLTEMSGEAVDNGDIIRRLFRKKNGATYTKETIQEEQILLIEELGSKYCGHITVKSGSVIQ